MHFNVVGGHNLDFKIDYQDDCMYAAYLCMNLRCYTLIRV